MRQEGDQGNRLTAGRIADQSGAGPALAATESEHPKPAEGRGSAREPAPEQKRKSLRRWFETAAGTESSWRLFLLAALAGCISAPVFVGADVHTPARVVSAILVFCLAPGVSVLKLLNRNARFELGLIVAVSLGALTLLAEAMLAVHYWRPEQATFVVSGLCLLVLLRPRRQTSIDRAGDETRVQRSLTLIREYYGPNAGIGGPPTLHVPEATRRNEARALPGTTNSGPPHDGLQRLRPGLLRGLRQPGHVVLLGAAVAAWVVALRHTHLSRIEGFGLLNALPVAYYIALVILTLGFAAAVSARVLATKVVAAYTLVLIVVLHGTAAALYSEPRYAWMYKHLGVIDYITVHGAVHRQIDIYHNWPGFFGLNAWFARVSGLAPISYAAWAQVFFELANAAALLFAVRGLTRDIRVQWVTVWIFVVANWVGQDYLAPQTLGFVLVLVTLGICLRCAPAPAYSQPEAERRWRRWLKRLGGNANGDNSGRRLNSLSPRQAAVLGAICALAAVISHQLSPVMLIFALAAFSLMTRRIPFWIPLAVAAVETWWIVLAWPYLGKHFSLFSFDLFPNARPKGENLGHALRGVAVVADMSRVVVVAMTLLALVGAVRARRSGRLDLAALGFAISPFPIVALQSYGGEILFRVYLFALPWLAYFTAVAVLPAATSPLRVARQVALTTCLIGTGFLFAYFGLEKINHVTRDDVAAVTWYEQNAPTGSVMAYAAPSLPDRLVAGYSRVRIYGDSYVPQLTDIDALHAHRISSRDLPEIISFLRGAHARHTYLVVSPSEENFVRLYGIMPAGSLPNLTRLLRRSPSFRLVYRHGRAWVFLLRARRS